jgi:sigma-B regulation protein RsbQ
MVAARNSVRISGNPDGRPIVFAHGYGCSQAMWRGVTPAFEQDFRVVTFDLVGAGDSDLRQYDEAKYDSLHGYADDVVDMLRAYDLEDVVFVGHSVSSMIGVLAATAAPELFGALVLVGPSPRYVDDVDYSGGFSRSDIDALLEALDANPLGWSEQMSHVIVGNADRPELADEWEQSFCRIDPTIARHFARVTFLSDNRADLARVTVPTLVLQSQEDAIAPQQVGHWVHEHIAGSTLETLSATGHIPNISAPADLADRIRRFLR